jgi:creatinine amidohydrolase/Fe(II)-dependent formamide hydrolase-like protein
MAPAPELVRMEDLQLDPPRLLELQIKHPDTYQRAQKVGDDELLIPRMTQRPDIRVGVMGHPERATRELGLRIVEDALESLTAKVTELESRADGVYRDVTFTPTADHPDVGWRGLLLRP